MRILVCVRLLPIILITSINGLNVTIEEETGTNTTIAVFNSTTDIVHTTPANSEENGHDLITSTSTATSRTTNEVHMSTAVTILMENQNETVIISSDEGEEEENPAQNDTSAVSTALNRTLTMVIHCKNDTKIAKNYDYLRSFMAVYSTGICGAVLITGLVSFAAVVYFHKVRLYEILNESLTTRCKQNADNDRIKLDSSPKDDVVEIELMNLTEPPNQSDSSNVTTYVRNKN